MENESDDSLVISVGVSQTTSTVIDPLGKLIRTGPCRELMCRYNWRPQIPSGNGPTGAHILVALTAAFGTLAFFSLLHSASNLRSGAASFFLTVSSHLLVTDRKES
jgi:hypothetical protein